MGNGLADHSLYLISVPSDFKQPRSPYPAAGTGNKGLCDNALRHDRILELPVLLRMCSTPCFK